MKRYEELIIEGEELEKTFTEEAIVYKITTDEESVLSWMEKCILAIEKDESKGKESEEYEIFNYWLNNIGNVDKTFFNELIGLLKGEPLPDPIRDDYMSELSKLNIETNK